MNLKPAFVFVVFLLALSTHGQGTFVYDQQSSDESKPSQGNYGITSFQQPVGQSFIPTLPFVDFIRLQLLDGNPGNGLGASIFVNLRANSITGAVLGATSPVFIPDNNAVTFTNFFFSTVSVTPGVTYYFQPVIQSGDGFLAGAGMPANYPNGMAFVNGAGNPIDDFWFREGVIPEPSSTALLLTGVGTLALAMRQRRR